MKGVVKGHFGYIARFSVVAIIRWVSLTFGSIIEFPDPPELVCGPLSNKTLLYPAKQNITGININGFFKLARLIAIRCFTEIIPENCI